MKKILLSLLTLIALITLGGCSTDSKSDLQSKEWNVVSTNGEAYSAEFGENTVSFILGGNFRVGFNYEIVEDELTLTQEADEEPLVFQIEKSKEEYTFKAIEDEVKEQYGDLTLSPKVSNE